MNISQENLRGHGLTVLKGLLLILIVYSPFFLHLGDLPVRIWDEARLIANTLEMSENGNYLVPHFKGNPEMWNTKPPLMIWCQLFFLKLIGNEELSFRLPSAIAGFLTSLMIVLVFSRYFKSYWFGLLAVLVLVTSNGYVGEHVTRTGDYDALLTFFTTLYAFGFFLYLESGKQKYLHLFFAGLALAVLTKSVQGLLFLPALALYPLMTGNMLKILKNKWIYIDLVLVSLVVAGYYFFRESVNPGYIDAVFNNELGGRYLETNENHRQAASYYLDLLTGAHFGTWFFLLPLGFFAGFSFENGIFKRIAIFSLTLSVVYLLIISYSGTKLAWYDAPLFPFLAILVSLVMYKIFSLLTSGLNKGKFNVPWLLPALLVVSVFFLPYRAMLDKVYKPKETSADAEFCMISHFLRDAVKGDVEISGHYVCYDGYNVHLTYYTDQLNKKGKKVFFFDKARLRPGDQVVFSQHHMQQFMEKTYLFEETGSYYNVKKIRINGIRNQQD